LFGDDADLTVPLEDANSDVRHVSDVAVEPQILQHIVIAESAA
jgi:hypothetical protein